MKDTFFLHVTHHKILSKKNETERYGKKKKKKTLTSRSPELLFPKTLLRRLPNLLNIPFDRRSQRRHEPVRRKRGKVRHHRRRPQLLRQRLDRLLLQPQQCRFRRLPRPVPSHQNPTVLLRQLPPVLDRELVLGDLVGIDDPERYQIQAGGSHQRRDIGDGPLGFGGVDLALAVAADEAELLALGFSELLLGGEEADRGRGVEAGVDGPIEVVDGVAGAASGLGGGFGGLFGNFRALKGLPGLELGFSLGRAANVAGLEEERGEGEGEGWVLEPGEMEGAEQWHFRNLIERRRIRRRNDGGGLGLTRVRSLA